MNNYATRGERRMETILHGWLSLLPADGYSSFHRYKVTKKI